MDVCFGSSHPCTEPRSLCSGLRAIVVSFGMRTVVSMDCGPTNWNTPICGKYNKTGTTIMPSSSSSSRAPPEFWKISFMEKNCLKIEYFYQPFWWGAGGEGGRKRTAAIICSVTDISGGKKKDLFLVREVAELPKVYLTAFCNSFWNVLSQREAAVDCILLLLNMTMQGSKIIILKGN